jgi:hypothetical protein
MELIITLIALIIIWCVAFLVGAKQGANRIVNQIKKDGGYFDMEYTSSAYPIFGPTSSVDTMGSIGSKPKTQTDYQNEHKVEDEKADINFMHNWIQEKSGKKDPISQKRKPKTTKEWEDEFDLGGHE